MPWRETSPMEQRLEFVQEYESGLFTMPELAAEYGISRKVTFQSLFFFQNSLRRSGQYPNFFVPVGDFAPTSYRLQQQLVFAF